MAELSAFILAYNEAENIPSLMDSLKGVRDVVVLDNGSDDGTQELFRKHGARVFDGAQIGKYAATDEDVALFKERFGIDPLFVPGELFDHAGERRNHAASLCRNDWVVNPDCDERPEWNLKNVRAMMNGQGGLRHRYVFKHNPDGTPLIEFIQCKLYNRQQGMFTGRIHEVLVDKATQQPVASDFCQDFVLHHWQKERPHRASHLKQMQFQAVREETVRNLHYLGREYADRGEWANALAVYARYFTLEGGDFAEQRAQACMISAESHKQLGQITEAVEACHMAMMLDDTRRDPFFLLGQIYMELNQFKKALIYFSAANVIPYNPQGFMNDMRLYTWAVHDKLSVCYQRLNMIEAAHRHWEEALKHLPDDTTESSRILANGRHMFRRQAHA
jgi:tetratricopeptide (TPR) repeat protein